METCYQTHRWQSFIHMARNQKYKFFRLSLHLTVPFCLVFSRLPKILKTLLNLLKPFGGNLDSLNSNYEPIKKGICVAIFSIQSCKRSEYQLRVVMEAQNQKQDCLTQYILADPAKYSECLLIRRELDTVTFFALCWHLEQLERNLSN